MNRAITKPYVSQAILHSHAVKPSIMLLPGKLFLLRGRYDITVRDEAGCPVVVKRRYADDIHLVYLLVQPSAMFDIVQIQRRCFLRLARVVVDTLSCPLGSMCPYSLAGSINKRCNSSRERILWISVV